MQLADAMKEKGVVMTKSPSLTLAAMTHRCNPLVPELTPTAWRTPTYAAAACSKAAIWGPMLRNGVCKTCTTAAISASVRSGEDIGMWR